MTSMRCLRYFLLLLLLQFLHPPTTLTTSVPGIVCFEFVSFSPFDQSAAELAQRAAATASADASEADRVALEFINAQLKIAMGACVRVYCSFCTFDFCSFNWWDYVLCSDQSSVCT